MTRKRNKRKRRLPQPQAAPGGPSPHSIWLLSACLPIVLCALQLNRQLWYDEVYTVVRFVSRPWYEIIGDYSAANNHIFYSLLLRPVFLLDTSEFALRLPSFVFSVGTLWCTFQLGRSVAGIAPAATATLVLGLMPMFYIHTMQVRGYGLSMFLAAALALLSLKRPLEQKPWHRWLITLLGTGFIYTVPTNTFFFGATFLAWLIWLAKDKPSAYRAITAVSPWILALVLATIVYWPVRFEMLKLAQSRPPATLADLVDLAVRVLWAIVRSCPITGALALVALPLAYGVRKGRQISWDKFAWFATLLVGPLVLTGFARVVPFVRNYCPMLPIVAVAVACGFTKTCEIVLQAVRAKLASGKTIPASLSPGVVACVFAATVGLAQLAIYRQRLLTLREHQPRIQDGYYAYYVFDYRPADVVKFLKQYLADKPSYRVVFPHHDRFALLYYFALLEFAPQQNPDEQSPIIVVAPPGLDEERLVRETEVPQSVLQKRRLLARLDYYCIYECRAETKPP